MPELEETVISCGIRALSGLCREVNHYDPQDQIPCKKIILESFNSNDGASDEDWMDWPTRASEIRFGIVLYSDSVRRGNGKRLTAYIKKNKLGKVTASDIITNPNTNRQIQLWTWYLDREALVKWLTANK